MLAPRPVPIAHSRGDAFDAMVLHAVDHLQPRLAEQLAQVEFAVEDVPEVSHRGTADFDFDDDILDDNAVPLSRLYRNGVAGISAPVIVVYRRPLESRARRARTWPTWCMTWWWSSSPGCWAAPRGDRPARTRLSERQGASAASAVTASMGWA